MNFAKHLFVSYAHVDDLPTPGDEHGWVTRFHKYLETYLSQSMGEEAKIWRDDRLRGNDIFANEIVKQFPETAVLLSVLSPRYLDSEWCLKEVNEFCRSAESHGGLTVEDKARVFRVMLKRIPTQRREQLPNILRDALGYEFYESDGTRELPLDPSFGTGETYRRQIYFLAQDIADLISNLRQKEDDHKKEALGTEKPTVYLAECSHDLREQRDKIRGELRAHGNKVLPDQMAQLPDLESEYIAEVTRLLESCQLSVHLIGASRGKLPDGAGSKSAIELQNQVAADLSAKSGLHRLVWLPEGTRSDQPDHQDFISALLRVPDLQRGADVITTNIETFKAAIHSVLSRLESSTQRTHPDNSQLLVHLICDQRDRSATIPLRKYLKSQGIEVVIPVFEGNAMQVRQANEDFLRRCDAVIVFYGAGDEAWRYAIESDLRKAAAYRDHKPLVQPFTFLGAPLTEDKQELVELGDSYIVNGLSGFNESDMKPVIDLLRSR